MKPLLIAVGVAGLLLGLVDPALAQGDYRVYPIFELTDEQVAMIDVTDGYLDDWKDVVGEPTLGTWDFPTYTYSGLPSRPLALEEGLYDPVALVHRGHK